MAEPTEVQFGVWSLSGDSSEPCITFGPEYPWGWHNFEWIVSWHIVKYGDIWHVVSTFSFIQ